MRSMKKAALVCMLVMSFCSLFSVSVFAGEQEEKSSIIDGSLLTDGTFAEDTVSILTRGNYLSNGMVQLKNKGNRVLGISGTTSCHVTCDKVICNLYLEQLDENGNWYTYKYWTCSTTNAYTYSPTKLVSVAGGHWYRARGAHSVTKNGVVESIGTKTDGIWVG